MQSLLLCFFLLLTQRRQQCTFLLCLTKTLVCWCCLMTAPPLWDFHLVYPAVSAHLCFVCSNASQPSVSPHWTLNDMGLLFHLGLADSFDNSWFLLGIQSLLIGWLKELNGRNHCKDILCQCPKDKQSSWIWDELLKGKLKICRWNGKFLQIFRL